jgi:glycosyltransferase involved in cell wall biosynthesis
MYPLVSILIPNYNYGKYAYSAIKSCLNQTYPNIEIIFQDNHSDDASYLIVHNFAQEYPEKIVLLKNVVNSGGGTENLKSMIPYAKGSYYFFFCSDDLMKPTCIENAIRYATKYPSAGLIMVEREEIDENNNLLKDTYLPFYDRSFFIEGKKHLPVFLLSGITNLSQIMVKKESYYQCGGISDIFKVSVDWFINFTIASISDVIYIHEPLIQYRIHSKSEIIKCTTAYMPTFQQYNMLLSFIKVAKSSGWDTVVDRKDVAIKKLGQMCLRYAVLVFKNKNYQPARNYLFLALIFDRDLIKDPLYILIAKYLKKNNENLSEFSKKMENGSFSTKRVISYTPPSGYTEL